MSWVAEYTFKYFHSLDMRAFQIRVNVQFVYALDAECDAENNPCHDAPVTRSRKSDACNEDTELKIGNWQSVPFGEQQPPCFYRLSSESKVSAGATVHIEARVKRGKATVFIGTASNVRQQHMKKLSLDVTGLDRDIYERKMSATRTVYIGVDALADTECEIKYEYVGASNNYQAAQTPKPTGMCSINTNIR